jgi:hypothetical protein
LLLLMAMLLMAELSCGSKKEAGLAF